ncbi:MAG TPA: hypothetical protein VNO81_09300 [Candidatus Nitrosotenuis sp.]|jgi:hypothetical protein|nr:hypothetical protein [Candidatus Nitrosotenuis sp.]
MPCNVGYRETFRARVGAPAPRTFRTSAAAPALDQELLDRIGVEDPEFGEWLADLETGPLLQEALERTRQALDTSGLQLSLGADGSLTIQAQAADPGQRSQVQARADQVLARWQLEVLGVVAQILGYQTRVTEQGLTAVKPTGEASPEMFTVTPEGGLRLRFEHFKSRRSLSTEVARLALLARRLGLGLDLESLERGGRPPQGQAQGGELAEPE